MQSLLSSVLVCYFFPTITVSSFVTEEFDFCLLLFKLGHLVKNSLSEKEHWADLLGNGFRLSPLVCSWRVAKSAQIPRLSLGLSDQQHIWKKRVREKEERKMREMGRRHGVRKRERERKKDGMIERQWETGRVRAGNIWGLWVDLI